jgi:hypothetical protein
MPNRSANFQREIIVRSKTQDMSGKTKKADADKLRRPLQVTVS